MSRAFILVMDSFGIGAAPDAAGFGDAGADTLGHIAAACLAGNADRAGLRQGPLQIPNLVRLGLAAAAEAATGRRPLGLSDAGPLLGAYGAAAEASRGKDTPSGHWEIAGVPVRVDWGYFPRTVPAFPERLVAELIAQSGIPGILGNCHGSGTEIVAELGEEHIRSGQPICYTSADSVFQIAAHETHFGLERLYRLCELAKRLTEPLNVARVIARPFVGNDRASFRRTANRRDYTTPPPSATLLDHLVSAGREVIGIGKIADIFAHRGITQTEKAEHNMGLFDATLSAASSAPEGSLVFTNFVDFDMLFGHRRDVAGYAAALEAFDRRMPELQARLRPDDLLLITADHGCDPTWPGTDHTREFVPVLFFRPAMAPRALGRRESFADMGQTIARHLGLPPLEHGRACLV